MAGRVQGSQLSTMPDKLLRVLCGASVYAGKVDLTSVSCLVLPGGEWQQKITSHFPGQRKVEVFIPIFQANYESAY